MVGGRWRPQRVGKGYVVKRIRRFDDSAMLLPGLAIFLTSPSLPSLPSAIYPVQFPSASRHQEGLAVLFLADNREQGCSRVSCLAPPPVVQTRRRDAVCGSLILRVQIRLQYFRGKSYQRVGRVVLMNARVMVPILRRLPL